MNYKRIISSRALRAKILACLNWIPDRIMVPLQYWIHTGRKLNLKKPQRFTEKLQVYKLQYRNSEMLRCTDKYTVREFVREKGLSNILIPLIGVYDSTDMIKFDSLPEQFVAKTSDGGGGNQVFICRNKDIIDKNIFFSKLNDWMSQPKPKKQAGREWAYENGQPRRILIETLISDPKFKSLLDYKFFCFHGKVGFVYGISDRKYGETARIGIYDKEFNKLNVSRTDERPQDTPLPRPKNYDLMISIAEQLSKDFPEVRVDLYNVDGKIYFGELTFYDGSGYMGFNPDSFDFEAGELFDINIFVE